MKKVQTAERIPIIYLYLYRNMIALSLDGVLTTDKAINSLRKIIYKSPRVIYREILKDMVCMEMLVRVNKSKYIILNNKNCLRQLKRLREYVFPLSL